MTNKRQVKEEIILAVKNAIYNNADIDVDCDCVQTDGNGVDHIADEVAEALYNAGYRKVGKNAVVLTREEYDRLNACIKSEEEVRAIMQQQMLPMFKELVDKEMNKKLATVTALERKATAQEFLLQVVKRSSRMEMVSNGIVLKTTYSIDRDELIEIAKQLGV